MNFTPYQAHWRNFKWFEYYVWDCSNAIILNAIQSHDCRMFDLNIVIQQQNQTVRTKIYPNLKWSGCSAFSIYWHRSFHRSVGSTQPVCRAFIQFVCNFCSCKNNWNRNWSEKSEVGSKLLTVECLTWRTHLFRQWNAIYSRWTRWFPSGCGEFLIEINTNTPLISAHLYAQISIPIYWKTTKATSI